MAKSIKEKIQARLDKSGFNPKDHPDILSWSDYIESAYKGQNLSPKQATDIATTLWANNGADTRTRKASTAAKGGIAG